MQKLDSSLKNISFLPMMACTLRTDARSNNSEYNDLRTNEPLDNHMYAITSKTETCVTVAMNHTMGTTSLEVPVTTLTDMFNALYVMSPYITQVSWKHHQFQGTYQGKRGWINNPMIFLEVKDSLELNVVLEGSQTTEMIVLAHDVMGGIPSAACTTNANCINR